MYKGLMVAAGLMVMVGCGQPNARDAGGTPMDPLIARLHHGAGDLQDNLLRLHEHIAELTQLPPSGDPILDQLRALDLAGWNLHERQWQLQLDHLNFALNRLHQVETGSTPKGRLREEWVAEQQRFSSSLHDLREKRHELEQKRLLFESQLIQRYFD